MAGNGHETWGARLPSKICSPRLPCLPYAFTIFYSCLSWRSWLVHPDETTRLYLINQIFTKYIINWRKFRSQTSDNMDRLKTETGRVREKRRVEERSEKRKNQKKEDPGARKGWKVAKHCVFPMICGSGGSTSRLAKAAGAEPAGQMRDEQLHAVVARSTFRSQNLQNTPGSDHFWKLRCRKSARCCGPKHISKSKPTKHTMLGPLLEVEMLKKCTPLWREAHLQVKKLKKTLTFGPRLEVEMSKKCTRLWREAHFEVKMYKAPLVRATFGGSDVLSPGRRKGLCTFSRVSKNVRILRHFQKRWQAWDLWRGSAKMHFPWQAQYKRHLHQSC